MSKPKKRSYHISSSPNRMDYKVLNDDLVIFRRHDRRYRLSNVANNWIPGKLFVLLNANTTQGTFDAADRLNLLSSRSRTRTAKLFAELWQLDDHKAVAQDLNIILEVLSELGMTEVTAPTNPADAPREFGKPWSAKGRDKQRKLARV